MSAKSGFTLVELLTVMGIIALLVAILLPAINRSRRQAAATVCASNLRQLTLGLTAYASENRGRYPMSKSAPYPGWFWCYDKCVGKYVAWKTQNPIIGDVGGGAWACPADPDGQRSYTMNFWASSAIDNSTANAVRQFNAAQHNLTLSFWNAATRDATRLMLIADTWSIYSMPDGYYAAYYMGAYLEDEGRKFGGGAGIPLMNTGRYGWVNCELPYMRHRMSDTPRGARPVGAVNVGYADGHVAFKRHDDLYVPESGASTRDTLWYPEHLP